MENQDKIFEQIKNAAKNQENNDFSGLEKVWSRVDAKLDTHTYTKQQKTNTNWHKYAVAASVVVGTMFAFQLAQKFILNQPTIEKQVVEKTTKPNKWNNETSVAIAEKDSNSVLIEEKEAVKILEKQIHNQTVVINNTKIIADTISIKPSSPAVTFQAKEERVVAPTLQTEAAYEQLKKDESLPEAKTKSAANVDQASKKAPPLVVVDGKVKDKEVIDASNIQEEIYLDDPLYIINGKEYSEKELFGPNPTSPYYPLNKQDIESLSIYQNEEAIEVYGKKGEKGVVVIKTKNGKPAALKK